MRNVITRRKGNPMIRTAIVRLTTIPAVAYRQKLAAGGSGIIILRPDTAQPGIAGISKTSGEAIPTANADAALFPPAAFAEAIELTAGLPFKKLGGVKVTADMVAEPVAETAEEVAEEAADAVIVDGEDYAKIVERYTDKKGALSYALLNKEFIQFAHSSSVVRAMIGAGESVEAIRAYIAGTKFRSITKSKSLDDAQVAKIVELLDEVSPKGVFRELNEELRKMLAKAKG